MLYIKFIPLILLLALGFSQSGQALDAKGERLVEENNERICDVLGQMHIGCEKINDKQNIKKVAEIFSNNLSKLLSPSQQEAIAPYYAQIFLPEGSLKKACEIIENDKDIPENTRKSVKDTLQYIEIDELTEAAKRAKARKARTDLEKKQTKRDVVDVVNLIQQYNQQVCKMSDLLKKGRAFEEIDKNSIPRDAANILAENLKKLIKSLPTDKTVNDYPQILALEAPLETICTAIKHDTDILPAAKDMIMQISEMIKEQREGQRESLEAVRKLIDETNARLMGDGKNQILITKGEDYQKAVQLFSENLKNISNALLGDQTLGGLGLNFSEMINDVQKIYDFIENEKNIPAQEKNNIKNALVIMKKMEIIAASKKKTAGVNGSSNAQAAIKKRAGQETNWERQEKKWNTAEGKEIRNLVEKNNAHVLANLKDTKSFKETDKGMDSLHVTEKFAKNLETLYSTLLNSRERGGGDYSALLSMEEDLRKINDFIQNDDLDFDQAVKERMVNGLKLIESKKPTAKEAAAEKAAQGKVAQQREHVGGGDVGYGHSVGVTKKGRAPIAAKEREKSAHGVTHAARTAQSGRWLNNSWLNHGISGLTNGLTSGVSTVKGLWNRGVNWIESSILPDFYF